MRTDRQSSSRHLDRHSAEHDRREAGTRADVVVPERLLAVHQQLATVISVIVRQLHAPRTDTMSLTAFLHVLRYDE